jgi:hypothetical protein
VLADGAKVPDCREYRKYVKQVSVGKDESGVEKFKTVEDVPDGVEPHWATAKIDRAEAVKLLQLLVRLTDKGLGQLSA